MGKSTHSTGSFSIAFCMFTRVYIPIIHYSSMILGCFPLITIINHEYSQWYSITSSTAQGGGGSFKNRKPIGKVGCCESRMAERSHWWIERWLMFPLFLSLSLTIYLPTYLPTYVSIDLSTYLSIYLPIYLSIDLSIYLSLPLSLFHLSICLAVYLFICLSICLSTCLSVVQRHSV